MNNGGWGVEGEIVAVMRRRAHQIINIWAEI